MLSLLLGIKLLKPGWQENVYLRDFITKTSNGGKAVSGPLLVLQGLADTNIDAETTTQAIEATASACLETQLEYHTWEGVTHDPLLYASQRLWLDWIADRFAGKPMAKRYSRKDHKPALPQHRHSSEINWILKGTTEMHELAMP